MITVSIRTTIATLVMTMTIMLIMAISMAEITMSMLSSTPARCVWRKSHLARPTC